MAAGGRRLDAVAVASGTTPPTPPCGACLQVLAELGGAGAAGAPGRARAGAPVETTLGDAAAARLRRRGYLGR